MELARIQANIDKDLFRRTKAIAGYHDKSIGELLAELLEDYVEKHEEKYLDEVFGKRRQAALDGKTVGDMPNVQKFYEEILKK